MESWRGDPAATPRPNRSSPPAEPGWELSDELSELDCAFAGAEMPAATAAAETPAICRKLRRLKDWDMKG